MSANPLKRQAETSLNLGEEHLMSICDTNNRWAHKRRFPRWYYVEPKTDDMPAKIMTMDGIEAEEVWTVLAGRKVDYAGWEPEKLEKIERRCRWLIKQGIYR